MKDNFSAQASQYVRFRPTYPSEIYRTILKEVPQRDFAWDCGTGNGQVSVVLANHFRQVYASDISRKQMNEAPPQENITYRQEAAEEVSLPDGTVDLVIVAQAVHWFDFKPFFQQVDRVLKPHGIIALLGYQLLHIDLAVDKVVQTLYSDILGEFWDPERRYIEAGYQTIPFPFNELTTPQFELTLEWTYEQLVGYLTTWSAAHHYHREKGADPIELIRNDLKQAWGKKKTRTVVFPLLLRVGRK